MNIQLIDTGYFYADGGAMFGKIPKTSWRRSYLSNEANGCLLAIRSALVSTGSGRQVLIDNGAGDKHLKKLAYYRFSNLSNLSDELIHRGTAAEKITDVVLTHLHFDHCGYSTRIESGRIVPSFPNATYWVSRSQWQNFLHPNPLEKDSYFTENMQAVFDAGILRLIDTDTPLDDEIDLRLYDGHTPGQIAPYIHAPEQTYVFAGDVIPLAASLSPGWISAYDISPLHSYTEKVRMLEEAATQQQAIIFCHDAYTRCCTVKKVGSYFKKDKEVLI